MTRAEMKRVRAMKPGDVFSFVPTYNRNLHIVQLVGVESQIVKYLLWDDEIRRFTCGARGFNTLRMKFIAKNSIRVLEDLTAPVPDDRPAEVIPEDYYTCH